MNTNNSKLGFLEKFESKGRFVWIITGITSGLIVAIISIVLWSNYITAKISKLNNPYLIDLPQDTDYANLTSNQENALIKEIDKKYPTQDETITFNIIKNIEVTQNSQPIPNNQPPLGGTNNIDPIKPENKPDDLKWPTFTFGYGANNQNDLPEAAAGSNQTKDLVEKYYSTVVDIFGLPYDVENRTISFIYFKDADLFGYLPQYDSIVVNSSDAYEVIPGLLSAFYGPYFNLMPETWKYGMVYAASRLAMRQFPDDQNSGVEATISNIMSNYEKYNVQNYPIWGTDIHYQVDILPSPKLTRVLSAAAAFIKPYQYDNQVFSKVNQKIFTLDQSQNFWQDDIKIGGLLASEFPTVEEMSPGEWYGQQHVLHQTITNPLAVTAMRVFGQTFILDHNARTKIYGFKSHVTGNGIVFVPKGGIKHQLKIKEDDNDEVGNRELTADNKGLAQVDSVLDMGINSHGRYVAQVKNSLGHFVYLTSGFGNQTLYGAVLNFGIGSIAAHRGQDLIEEVPILNGAFQFNKEFSGVVTLVIKDYQEAEVLRKELAKDIGIYFTVIESLTSSFPATPSRRGQDDQDCDQDEELTNLFTTEEFKFTIGYADGFDVYDPSKSESHVVGQNDKLVYSAAAQFFKSDSTISITWHFNEDKTLEDFANDYQSDLDRSWDLEHWNACGKDIVKVDYKVNDRGIVMMGMENEPVQPAEGTSYFLLRGTDLFVVSSSRDNLTKDLAVKMVKSLKFF